MWSPALWILTQQEMMGRQLGSGVSWTIQCKLSAPTLDNDAAKIITEFFPLQISFLMLYSIKQ